MQLHSLPYQNYPVIARSKSVIINDKSIPWHIKSDLLQAKKVYEVLIDVPIEGREFLAQFRQFNRENQHTPYRYSFAAYYNRMFFIVCKTSDYQETNEEYPFYSDDALEHFYNNV